MELEPSAWKYATSASGALGVGFIAASGGTLYLTDPAGRTQHFYYGGLGGGVGFGVRLPKIPRPSFRGSSVSGTGAATAFPSTGIIYKARSIGRRELTPGDIQGAVMFVEGGLGLGVGGAGTSMIFGINTALMIAAALSPVVSTLLVNRAMATATGVMVFAGVNAGLQAGGGVAGLVGYLR